MMGIKQGPLYDVDKIAKCANPNEACENLEASCTANIEPKEETARVTDHQSERSLCFKLDIRLLPVLAVMCTFYSDIFFLL